jgi:uncharacterized protein YndB with AHSA1/START domain
MDWVGLRGFSVGCVALSVGLCWMAFVPRRAIGQDTAERMLNLATADQPLVHSAIINGPVAEVWKAYTTKEEMKSWMVAEAEIDLKVGGKIRTSYTKGSNLTGPDVIENTIISFDPMRMLSIKITKAPERFPFKNAMQRVWTVLYFEAVDEKRTRVTCRMLGYDHEEESVKMRLFFQHGNQQTMDALANYFYKRKLGQDSK